MFMVIEKRPVGRNWVFEKSFLKVKNVLTELNVIIRCEDLHSYLFQSNTALSGIVVRNWVRMFDEEQNTVYGEAVFCFTTMFGPHFVSHTQNKITLLDGYKWTTSPYSPDLAPIDFHCILHLKRFLASYYFNNQSVQE